MNYYCSEFIEFMMKCLKCLLPIEDDAIHYGLHYQCFSGWFEAPHSAQFTGLMRRSSVSFEQSGYASPQNTSFFHGKFKKYSASLNNVSYILKMREAEAPEIPEVEYLCNQIGRLLQIPIADFYIIRFEEELVFVTKNFIDPSMSVDLQHIYHFRPDEEHSCEGLIRVIGEQTKQPHAINIFIKTLLFDALIGNHDRHGRNLAFVIKSNQISLSPIYDNVTYLSLEKGSMLKADFNPTGKIRTQATFEPSMCDYIKELKRLGYVKEIENFYSHIHLSKIKNLIQESFCSILMKEAIQNLILKRFEEIENELNN